MSVEDVLEDLSELAVVSDYYFDKRYNGRIMVDLEGPPDLNHDWTPFLDLADEYDYEVQYEGQRTSDEYVVMLEPPR